MKVARGTARRIRRMDLDVFKAKREQRRMAEANAVTISVILAPRRPREREIKSNLHDVATITRLADRSALLRTYESTIAYPANVPAPWRRLLYTYPLMNYGAAKDRFDRINQI